MSIKNVKSTHSKSSQPKAPQYKPSSPRLKLPPSKIQNGARNLGGSRQTPNVSAGKSVSAPTNNRISKQALLKQTANGRRFNTTSGLYHAKLKSSKSAPKDPTAWNGKGSPSLKRIKKGDVFSEVALKNKGRVDHLRVLDKGTTPKQFKLELIENYRPVKGLAGVSDERINAKIAQVKRYGGTGRGNKFNSKKYPELNKLSTANSNLVLAVPMQKGLTAEQQKVVDKRVKSAKQQNVEIRQIPV